MIRLTFLAAFCSDGSPLRSNVSKRKGSIESKPIFKPEQIAAINTKNIDDIIKAAVSAGELLELDEIIEKM